MSLDKTKEIFEK